jgi:hypothetical protein
MAVLDTAIEEKPRHFNVTLDGRVKPTAVRFVLLAIVFNVIPEIA